VLLLPKTAIIRDAAIQRFKYVYELSVKLWRRKLEEIAGSAADIDLMSYRDMMRTAEEKGLIEDPVAWFEFRAKRNTTSHGYDEESAEKVYAVLPAFAKQAAFLLERLKQAGESRRGGLGQDKERVYTHSTSNCRF